MKKIFITAFLGFIIQGIHAQDIHFARTRDMQKWYNASMKNENDETTLSLNFRNVSYKQLVAFNSLAAIADISLISKQKQENRESDSYFSVSGGAAVDKSNSGMLRNTTALLGIAYHLPINNQRNTFLSMGAQGGYFESRINMDGVTTPDQFNKYGMIPNATAYDPAASGKINFFSLNAGVSVMHTGAVHTWYAGASARHLNKPEANLTGDPAYKLPSTISAQGGYKREFGNDALGIDVFLNFKAEAYEHVATVHYAYTFDKADFNGAIGASLGYRYNDAIIPGVFLLANKTSIGFNFDLTAAKNKSSVAKTSFELGLIQAF